MLKIFLCFLALNCCNFSKSYAEIFETDAICDIENYIRSDSLVLLNVTGTLYEPAMVLADNQWRLYFASRVEAIVTDQEFAAKLINEVKKSIVTYLPKKVIDANTPTLIRDMQEKQIAVFGITLKSRNEPFADDFDLITSKHLQNIGINLENTLSYIDVNPSPHFAYGLIFASKGPVGPAIVDFLEQLPKKPSNIIMVDNSLKNLLNAEISLQEIEFTGFRYGARDMRIQGFDPDVGTIQFFALLDHRLLTDEEAYQVKIATPGVNYNELLDQFIRSLTLL